MGQPLFAPAPVVVGSGYAIRNQVVDVVLVFESAGDAVGNAAGGVGEFPGIEIHVRRVVAAYTIQHAGVEGIFAENPVELVRCEGFKLFAEYGIAGQHASGKACGGGYRRQPGVLSLPPGSGVAVVREEEGGAACTGFVLDVLAAVAEGIVDLGRN